ncbi:hypothetical protein G7Z17_g1930 [Cylindrodendrum hubeiense]|uniref:Ankyrin n=1 Tax=Cylindrodendrum hubeiense TaxID=595255 RepID=A0A9P5LKY6_9HYPO|nr:hypothetical protein G7Z17_g1930 [Cylindrodendrum hubeiense]
MVAIEHLPTEVICLIADMCTLGVHPERGQYPSSYARHHSRFARTSRHFYDILNPALYKRNIHDDPLLDSCVLWAAQQGRLETMKVAHGLGASLDINGARTAAELEGYLNGVPGRLRFFATPLHLVIQNGHRHVLEYLLENGANVNVSSRLFCAGNRAFNHDRDCPPLPYPLHTALIHADEIEDAAAMLIKHGAYLVAEGTLALPIVAENGRQDLVDLLLDLNEPATTTATLRHAAKTQNLELFQRLLERPELSPETPDSLGRTALHFAASEGGIAFAKPLLERYETAEIPDSSGMTPLHHAARQGDVDLVDLLLQRPEVNAEAKDENGMTALHHAAEKASTPVIQRLLGRPEVNAGAQNVTEQTPLHLAARSGVPEIVDLLLQRADVDAVATDSSGCTILHYVSEAKGDTDSMVSLIERFIKMGVPVNGQAEGDGSALFQAVKHHNFNAALTLLAHGANPLITPLDDRYQWSILHHCLYGSGPKQTELVTKLLSHGVDMDTETTRDHDGTTPDSSSSCGSQLVFAAVYAENIECMRLLLEAGAEADCAVVFSGWDLVEGDLERGGHESFISALFRHVLGTTAIKDEDIERVNERLCLLLKYGSSLDAYGCGVSPLEWGCMAAIDHGSFALLKSLLGNATKSNISFKYLRKKIAEYEEDSEEESEEESDEDSDEQERVKEVIQLLTEFKEREFAGEQPVGGDSSDEESEDEDEDEEDDDDDDEGASDANASD